MMHNDLSNQVKATIAFMCEDFLIKYKDTTFTDKILNVIVGKTRRAEVDEKVAHVMEFLYRRTEYNVDLLVDEKRYSVIKPLIGDLTYCRVLCYTKYSQITSRLLTGDLTYVIDDNAERRSLINSRYCISLSELNSMLKIGGRLN